jgi:hypothetical protein
MSCYRYEPTCLQAVRADVSRAYWRQKAEDASLGGRLNCELPQAPSEGPAGASTPSRRPRSIAIHLRLGDIFEAVGRGGNTPFRAGRDGAIVQARVGGNVGTMRSRLLDVSRQISATIALASAVALELKPTHAVLTAGTFGRMRLSDLRACTREAGARDGDERLVRFGRRASDREAVYYLLISARSTYGGGHFSHRCV